MTRSLSSSRARARSPSACSTRGATTPPCAQTLDEASAALDVDVATLIHAGPKEQLDLTTNTQPVMLTAGVACYRAWLAETQPRRPSSPAIRSASTPRSSSPAR